MKLVLDIEANSLMELTLDSKGRPVKECTKIHCVVTKDIDSGEVKEWTGDFKGMREYIDSATLLIGHNIIGFDMPCLLRIAGCKPALAYHDSLVVSKLMYPDLRDHPLGGNSLECWGKHLGVPKADYDGGWEEFSEEMLKYCVQDVHVAHAIYIKQMEWIKAKQYEKVVSLEHTATVVLMEQIANGFGFNLDAAEKLAIELLSTKADIEDQMHTIFPPIVTERWSEKTGKRLKDDVEVFNPGSRQQIAHRLKTKYGWKAPETDKGNPNVDAECLEGLDYPEAKKLIEYFNVVKLLGQVEDWRVRATHSRDGRIHGSINGQGAATGRCTHSQPNMAQVATDHRARDLWTALGDGEVVLGADLSGLELRMLAHYMSKYDNGAYGEVILNGDIHTHNQTKAGLPTRNDAKTFIYGFLYGAGDEKVGSIVKGSARQGKALKETFLRELPALNMVKKEVEFFYSKDKHLTLLDGRRVPIRSQHAALNTLLQGSGAVLSKYWMIVANRNLRWRFGKRVRQMAYVHDELQFSCPPDIAEEAGKIIVASATEAGERLGVKIRIDAEFKIGSSWGDTH